MADAAESAPLAALRALREKHAQPKAHRVLVSNASCCREHGSEKVLAELERLFKDSKVRLSQAGCTGAHFAHPTIQIHMADGRRGIFTAKGMPLKGFAEELKAGKMPLANRLVVFATSGRVDESQPFFAPQVRTTLRDAGFVDPTSLSDYLVFGGFEGLARALEQGADGALETLKQAALRGRGGVGFPMGQKAEFTRKGGAAPRYVVANGEEGEEDTFKDEVLLEANTFGIIEGMMIGALACGASEGFVFVNHDYVAAHEWYPKALKALKDAGLLGRKLLGSGFDFRCSLKISTAGYISGEESALLEVIEGRPARPRLRPPFPAQSGLWGRPTLINNTETFALAPLLFARGLDWWKTVGTAKSPGTKLVSVLGVPRAGVMEIPMGMAARDVVVGMGGADPEGLKAVQIGGPTGGYLLPGALDFALEFDTRRGHALMGAGGMVAVPKGKRAIDLALEGIRFMEEGSCGRCTPCREGTHAMRLLVEDLAHGKKSATPEDLARLARDMGQTSICGLGQTAGNSFTAVYEAFKPEIEMLLGAAK
jgi:NADH-quinone oxidoreductase subunit F